MCALHVTRVHGRKKSLRSHCVCTRGCSCMYTLHTHTHTHTHTNKRHGGKHALTCPCFSLACANLICSFGVVTFASSGVADLKSYTHASTHTRVHRGLVKHNPWDSTLCHASAEQIQTKKTKTCIEKGVERRIARDWLPLPKIVLSTSLSSARVRCFPYPRKGGNKMTIAPSIHRNTCLLD